MQQTSCEQYLSLNLKDVWLTSTNRCDNSVFIAGNLVVIIENVVQN